LEVCLESFPDLCRKYIPWSKAFRISHRIQGIFPHLVGLLEQLPLEVNSNDYLFDNQMLAQIVWRDYTIAEISCPTKYFGEASSISLIRSIKYGFGCLFTAFVFRLAKMKIFPRRFILDQTMMRHVTI